MKLAGLLPEGPPGRALALALNAGICLGLISRAALEPLRGASFTIEAIDLGARVRLAYGARGFMVHTGHEATDVTLRAALRDFVALALRRTDPDTLFFARRLTLSGDTELGLVAKNALDAVDFSKLAPASLARALGLR